MATGVLIYPHKLKKDGHKLIVLARESKYPEHTRSSTQNNTGNITLRNTQLYGQQRKTEAGA